MVKPLVVGSVVVIDFPFSDQGTKKRRPALVVATTELQDYIFCQITSRSRNNIFSLPLNSADFSNGSLPLDSHIRTDKLFTGNQSLVSYCAGVINLTKLKQVKKSLALLFEI